MMCYFRIMPHSMKRKLWVDSFREEVEQLVDYTKYKLKAADELASVLKDVDNLFVLACNKCFKEFDTLDEPDCAEFVKIAEENGKTVTGSARIDFLCY